MEGQAPAAVGDTKYIELPGFRPIAHLLRDPQVSEIMINGTTALFVERGGRMVQEPSPMRDEQSLGLLVESILRPTGRSIDARTPYVDARLPDGSRVNVILSPLSVEGTAITIRRATQALRGVGDLISNGTLSMPMARFLAAAMKAKLNLIFAGGTGTGKTTTLGIFAKEIPNEERIIVIEDTAELTFDQPNVVRLEARRASVEGAGAVSIEDLLRNSLRMRPTRVVMGELRGAEAVEMLQAVATGHDGCLSVLHAGSPTGTVGRLEMMVTSSDYNLPLWAIRKQIASCVDVIVQSEILRDGQRRLTYITDVVGLDGAEVVLRDLYRFEQGEAEGGTLGSFVRTDHAPSFASKFADRGIELPSDLR